MANRLKKLGVTFVSLVDRGAEPGAEVVLYKRDTEEDVVPKRMRKTDTADADLEFDFDELPDAVKAYIDELETVVLGQDATITDQGSALASLEKRFAKLESQLNKSDDDDDGEDDSDTDNDETEDEVGKADEELAAELKKRDDEIEQLRKQNTETQEALAKMAADRQRDQFVMLAKGWPNVPQTETEIADTLMKAYEKGGDELVEVMKANYAKTNDVVSNSSLFTEIGTTGNATVGGNVEAVAKALREKDTSLTPEQAVARAFEENPDLYTEYLKGN